MGKPYEYNWDRMKPYKFYSFASRLVRLIGPILFRIRVIGRENLPESASGVILASNHLHSIDPAFLLMATRMRWRFIAKKELYENKVSGWVCAHCNAFPVERGVVDRRALDYALAAMRSGDYGLGIFPEGTRSPDGFPHEGKAGVAMLARQTKADILPCSIYHEGKLGFRTKLTIRIGEVIPFEQLGLGETPNKRQSKAACEKIMSEITELWKQGHD